MPFYLRDVERAADRIRKACPDVILGYGDYGFRVDGWRVDANGHTITSTIRTIYQPARSDNGQPEIIADVDSLIKFWST